MFAGEVSVRFRTDVAGERIRNMEDEVNHLLPKPKGFRDRLILLQNTREIYLSRFSENRADTERDEKTALNHVTRCIAGLTDGPLPICTFMLARSRSHRMAAAASF